MATLIVEDGSGVEGANSYVTLREMRKFASDRGLTIPADDEAGNNALTALLIKATDELEMSPSKRGPWKGERTYEDPTVDTLSWPRMGVVIDGQDIETDQIPLNLKRAQMQLAVELQTVDPSPTMSGQLVKREKVDVLETEYAIDYKTGEKAPTLTKVDQLLQPLLQSVGPLRVSRG